MSELEPDFRTEEDDWQQLLANDPEYIPWTDSLLTPQEADHDA